MFKGKVFEQKRDITTNWKSHQENFDSQTKLRLTKPNNNMQSLDYITIWSLLRKVQGYMMLKPNVISVLQKKRKSTNRT